MRKHSVRKWLHAILDLLPLFVIPIFAIYSRNENAQFGYEVTQEVNKAVDFNQLAEGRYDRLEDFTANNINFTYEDNNIWLLNGTTTAGNVNILSGVNFLNGHKILVKTGNDNICLTNNQNYPTTKGSYILNINADRNVIFSIYSTNGQTYTNDLFVPQLYDLTQMFGVGNEPTIEQFNTYFTNSYYPYTESQQVVIENYDTITYNDTDIGSQMVYTLYNTVDKYFNMNNVFNMGAIWNWVNNTMFSGSAPLSAYIVYQIIDYELIMDIIFLLYSVMMFIVDFAEKGIDRFLGRSC